MPVPARTGPAQNPEARNSIQVSLRVERVLPPEPLMMQQGAHSQETGPGTELELRPRPVASDTSISGGNLIPGSDTYSSL